MKKIFLLFVIMAYTTFGAGHIFMYHRVGDDRHPSTSISVEAFEKQLDYLEKNGYEVVELSKIVQKIEKGEDVPENWVALTIDDAYRSFYENGLPLLKERRLPFTLFVNTEAVEKGYGDFMTWDMVLDTDKYGEIGGHSHTHASLPKVSLEKAKTEIELSKKLIEEKLGKEVRYIAYPYGEYSEGVKELVKEAGYEAAFKQVMGAVDKESDPYAINRIPAGDKTAFGFYLGMGYLPMEWKDVEIEGDILKSADVDLPVGVDRLEVFLSGYGWEWIPVENGRIQIDKKLVRSRNNLIIRDKDKRYNDYLILR